MKKIVYIIAAAFLGFLFSFILHAILEMIYLNYALKNNLEIIWTTVFGKDVCALPLWLIITLPILGIIFGLAMGFKWWDIIYIKKKRDKINF